MRRVGLILLLTALPWCAWAAQDVRQTVHNLSTSGPGTFKSKTVTDVCIFCHTPHNASPSVPLWNHEMSGATYIEYKSSTLRATTGQPTGYSRLCLSCHDGTVALGALRNLPGGVATDLANTLLTGSANLGTDLSDDHPVSFVYDNNLQAQNPQLAAPGQTGLPLENNELQCTSCHDAHEKDIVPFLREATLNGQLCITCHELNGATYSWATSSHATSTARPSFGTNPWAERKPAWRGQTVAENACFDCHMPHNAAMPQRLIKGMEEETCYLCHDGSVAAADIRSEILKPSRHAVDQYFGIHDAAESFGLNRPSDHVECEDCHNPHAADAQTAQAPLVPGPARGVTGIDATGAPVSEATNLYEVCFKCHGDAAVSVTPVVTRFIPETNTRLEFDLSNPSYHPVEGPGQNADVPSLIPPLTETSVIYCTDCHNSDSGANGPKGPHGSIFAPLLESNYTTADNAVESFTTYQLCYKCHDRTSILSDASFSEHRKHIVEARAPCSACHDPHGVSSIQGNALNNSHLINFDTEIVQPNSQGVGPVFEDLGRFSGQCSLLCHGQNHQAERY